MSNQFVGEIRVFGCNFAPTGWAFCDGQLLPISQNTALFSLLGTFYGGDGKSTFALPDMQGNIPIGQGQGAGLNDYFLGQQGGAAEITVLQSEIPVHNHNVQFDSSNGSNTASPAGNGLGTSAATNIYTSATSPQVPFNFQAISVAGSSFPHNNMMPYLTLNFCIALQGIFPPRS
jgi:microcystin-dependent protein